MNYILSFCYLMFPINTFCTEMTADTLHQYMWANYYQFEGNYKKAAAWYDKLLIDTAPLYAYKGYLIFLYETGSYAKIVTLMPRIEKKFEQDADLQLLLAQSLEKVGKQKASREKILHLASKFPTHPEIIFQAVQTYVQRQELGLGIKAIDTLLNKSPQRNSNFIFYFIKSQLYLQLGDKEQALIQVKNCLETQPHFGKGWLMLALLEEEKGHLDQAIKGYMTFLNIEGTGNTQIQQHLIELSFQQQIIQKRHDLLIMNKSYFDKALHFLETKEYTKAIEYIDLALHENPNDEKIRFLKINILSNMGNYVQAAELLKTWLMTHPNQEIWLSSLHLLCRTGLSCHKAIALLEDIIKRNPKEVLPLLYLIDIATRVSTPDTLIMYYKKALELVQDNDLKTRLYFHMAHIYYKHKKYDEMRNTLEKGYALGTDFPHLLNMLAYYYATGSANLDRAQQLMNAVFAKNKSNPHFQDTQAFIYYKQKKYTKALAILETVVKKVPDNFDVLKHLGKTYFKLGFIDKAVITLERARTIAESDYEKQKCTNLLGCWSKNS